MIIGTSNRCMAGQRQGIEIILVEAWRLNYVSSWVLLFILLCYHMLAFSDNYLLPRMYASSLLILWHKLYITQQLSHYSGTTPGAQQMSRSLHWDSQLSQLILDKIRLDTFLDIMLVTDVDECVPNPCLNGASCADGVLSFTCVCPVGYTGTNCETGLSK